VTALRRLRNHACEIEKRTAVLVVAMEMVKVAFRQLVAKRQLIA